MARLADAGSHAAATLRRREWEGGEGRRKMGTQPGRWRDGGSEENECKERGRGCTEVRGKEERRKEMVWGKRGDSRNG